MPDDAAQTTGRTRFGTEVRAQRTAKGWTQVALGNEIGYSGSFVSDVERGDRGVSEDFAIRCDSVFGLPGTLQRMWADLQREAFPVWFAPIVPIQRDATKIEGWEIGTVPGLLQTEAYTRSLVRAHRPGDLDEEVERTVQARVDRQRILDKAKPPLLFYVIAESVVRQRIGGAEVMSVQLDKLIKATGAPNVVIQILPHSAEHHAGASGLLYLYERPAEPLVAYTECFGGARLIMDPAEVSDMATVMTMLRTEALSPGDSAALIRTVRRDLEPR